MFRRAIKFDNLPVEVRIGLMNLKSDFRLSDAPDVQTFSRPAGGLFTSVTVSGQNAHQAMESMLSPRNKDTDLGRYIDKQTAYFSGSDELSVQRVMLAYELLKAAGVDVD